MVRAAFCFAVVASFVVVLAVAPVVLVVLAFLLELEFELDVGVGVGRGVSGVLRCGFCRPLGHAEEVPALRCSWLAGFEMPIAFAIFVFQPASKARPPDF